MVFTLPAPLYKICAISNLVQSVRIHSKQVAVLMTFLSACVKPEENKHLKMKKKGDLHEDGNENVLLSQDDDNWEVLSLRADAKIVRQIQRTGKTLLFMLKL